MRLRTLIFWTHLSAGVIAGLVILVMCVTGVLLTYERQLYAWADRGFRSEPVPAGALRMPIADLVARAQAQAPGLIPTAITVAADPADPVTIAAAQRTIYVDAYSGRILGDSQAQGVRRFMSGVKAWHRWLAVEGDGRQSARAITGWSNLLFLFIVASGIYLWVPRAWNWQRLRAVTLFNGRLRGKARDFNWHNVIGSWSAVPLFIVVFSAVPISFPWANAAVYRVMGDRVPAAGSRDAGRAGRAATAGEDRPASLDGIDRLFARVQQQEPDWQTIALRLPPSPRAPLAFAIDRGNGGQPHLRSTLTLTPAGEVVSYETFASQTSGRQARSVMRFAHTGEILGVGGQTIAGIATAGGTVLVYTGIALAVRRLRAFGSRRSRAAIQDARTAA
jgi:uncharacterized iron-regulated membrane protein